MVAAVAAEWIDDRERRARLAEMRRLDSPAHVERVLETSSGYLAEERKGDVGLGAASRIDWLTIDTAWCCPFNVSG